MKPTPAQLGQWFDDHAAVLVLYARQWVGLALAEDLVQDVFLRLAAQRNVPANVRAWLLASVRHAALDALKAARRRERRERQAGEEHGLFLEASADGMETQEVQKALAALPECQRELLTLRIWSGATLREISAITGLPVSTIHGRYADALEALRAHWEVPCPKN